MDLEVGEMVEVELEEEAWEKMDLGEVFPVEVETVEAHVEEAV